MMSYFKNFIKCKLGGSLFFELLHLNNWGEGKLQFLHQIKTYNLIYSENCRSKKKKSQNVLVVYSDFFLLLAEIAFKINGELKLNEYRKGLTEQHFFTARKG